MGQQKALNLSAILLHHFSMSSVKAGYDSLMIRFVVTRQLSPRVLDFVSVFGTKHYVIKLTRVPLPFSELPPCPFTKYSFSTPPVEMFICSVKSPLVVHLFNDLIISVVLWIIDVKIQVT